MISINKLHASAVALNFVKSAQNGVVYADDDHFLYFDCNSLIIDGFGTILSIDNIFKLIRATLRKYKCKHFQKLHIYFNDCNMLDRTTLNRLGLEIAAHFRNLREFTIQFFLCENLTDEDLKSFFVPLAKVLRNVTKLTINITCCEKFGDEGMNLLSSLLHRRFTNLKKLTLNLSEKQTQNGYEDNVPYNLDILSQIYERRTYDAAVTNFYDSGVTSNGVSLLCRYLTKYLSRNLNQLSLILPECGEPEEEFQNCSFRKNIIPTLKNLKKFNLHLYTFIDDMEVPEEDIVEIALNIGQYLYKLEYLTLDFSMLNQFDLATVASNIFPNLSDLKGLIMSYDNSRNVLDNQLTSFTTEMFKYMKKLEELAFCFRQYSEITNKAVQNIIQNINQDLHFLKKLTLDFRSPGIDAENIQLLSNKTAQSLEELNLYVCSPKLGINNHFVNLKKLTLLFHDCSEMTDSEFAEITHNLFSCSLTGLQELSLFFCDVKKITDDGVEALWSKNWAQLANLKVFALEFSQCRNISDVTLGLAGSCFQKNMKNLQTLMLIFSGSDYITTRGIEFLINSICKNLGNLENLHLNTFGHERVESKKREFIEEIGDQIANRLKKLKEVRLDLDIHHVCFEYEDNLALFRSLRKKMSFIRKLILN